MLRLEVTDRATEPPGPPRNYLFDRGPVCIGRSLRQNHISLRGNRISRVHIMLDLAENRWWLVHKGRFSPTSVNGKEIFHEEPVEVREGDLIVIERNEIVVHVDIDGAEMPTQMLDATPEIVAAQARIVAHARRVVGPPPPSRASAAPPPARPAMAPSPHPASPPPPAPPPRVEVAKPIPARDLDEDTFIDDEIEAPAPPAPSPPAPSPPPIARAAPPPPPPPAVRAVPPPPPPPVVRVPPPSPPPRPAPVKPSQSDTQDVPAVKPTVSPPIRLAPVPGTPPSAPSQQDTQDVTPRRPITPAAPTRPASESETRIGTTPAPSAPRPPEHTPGPIPGFPARVDRPSLGDTHIPVPKGVPRFEEKERLRSGGLGPILRAYDRAARTETVVERLPAALIEGAEDASAFHTLCGMLRGVAHAAVVRVLEAGQDEGGPFVLLDLPPGRTLADFMRAQPGGGSAQRIREMTESLADGLAHLHDCGVIHGNVHPGTVWIGDDGHARLLDAGFGAMAAQRASALGDADLGPIAYVAPESTRKTPRDPRSDQFGLGCVLYAYLTGEDPGARSAPLTERRKDVPRAVCIAIERAMSPSPAARFPTMQAFRESLYATVERRFPWTKVLAGAAVLLVAAAAAGFATGIIPRAYRSITRDPAAASACDVAREKALAAKAKWDAASAAAGVPPPESAQRAIDLLDAGRCAAEEVRDADATAAFDKAATELDAAAAAVTEFAQAREKARNLLAACSAAAKDAPAVAQAGGLVTDADKAAGAGKVAEATSSVRAAAALLEAEMARRAEAELQSIVSIRTQAEKHIGQLETLLTSNRKKRDDANARVKSTENLAGTRTAQLLADAKKAAAQADADVARLAALLEGAEMKSVRERIDAGAAALGARRNEEARAAYQAAADASKALVDKAQGR